MDRSSLKRASFVLTLALAGIPALTLPVLQRQASAQNAVTGALTGTVTDSSGAVIPNAQVTVTDTATQATQKVTTNGSGRYSVSLLKPSSYSISASTNGLQSGTTMVSVLVGQTATADLKLTPSGTSQTVTVSADSGQLTDTQSPALITTLTERQVQELPAPGGDITTVAFTAPGVVVNAGGSYGNFSSDGLPGTSNLYVLNGFDDEDPFLNLNNSGSSNLSLGQGEVAEAAVVQNGYSAQYGRAAGVIVNWTTKSGSNGFHGAANYAYNSDGLNANDWFRNFDGDPREKAVSNQWGANGGGPIIKDKVFFYLDYEGFHYVLPSSGYASFPTAPFEAAVLKNIPASDVPLYTQAFNLYNSSPSYAKAVPVTAATDSTGTYGCGSAAGLDIGGTVFGTPTTPCMAETIGSGSNINKEWLLTGRIDWHISDKNQLFGRYKMDRGSQPTYTNYISPIFNTTSSQPEYEGQLNDTYALNTHVTNQFIFAANWYTAYFGPTNLNATLAAFPTFFNSFSDGGGSASASSGGVMTLGLPYYFPQGRNVTQYQFVDDLTWVKGNHTLRFGYNFRRSDISDFDAQEYENGVYSLTTADFAQGALNSGASSYTQNFTNVKTSYLALYNIGVYAQDEYQPTARLKLTFGIRFDRTGNPNCTNSCFSQYNGTFPFAGVNTLTPYNQLTKASQSAPFNDVQKVNTQPRIGFNYDVTGDGHTVVRGGFGLFTDLYPAGFLDNFIQNFPNLYSATLTSGNIGPAGSAGAVGTTAAASYNQLESSYATGATYTSTTAALAATGVPFTAPNYSTAPSTFKNPTYAEWNLQIQRQFSRTDSVILGYVGNVGYDGILQNGLINGSSTAGFGGLPTTSPDPNFTAVNAFTNNGHSNYNGASATYKHIDNHGLSVDLTYTYSHALDDISNGGEGEYYNLSSITKQVAPNLALNYGNSDYDTRHDLNADYVYDLPFKFHNFAENEALGGWSIAGKSYWRTGQPFSVINSQLASSVGAGTLGSTTLLAEQTGLSVHHCGPSATNTSTPCLDANSFATTASQTGFGNVARNSFYGPHYADTDLSLFKSFYTREKMNLQLGANAFNVANHPNFALPGGDVNNGLGNISSTVSPPTSPYGSFQGSAVSGRVLQVFGRFTF